MYNNCTIYIYIYINLFFKSTEKPHHFHLQNTTVQRPVISSCWTCCVLTNVSLVTSMAQAHSVPSNHSPGKITAGIWMKVLQI